ncbi:MAG: hypothetical protein ACI8QS_001619 [Planctomycetota bacterium]|jgi:hypothetical protein
MFSKMTASSLGRIPGPLVSTFATSAAVLAMLLGTPSSAQNARPPVDLQPSVNSVGSRVAVDTDGDLTAVVWVDEVLLQVFCSVSDGRGAQWSTPERVDEGLHSGGTFPLTFLHETSVQVRGQNIYVSWRELGLQTGNGHVMFASSTNAGASFLPEITLDDGLANQAKTPRSIMAVSADPAGDHIYIMRLDSNAVFAPMIPRVVASHDGGQSFGSAVSISLVPSSGFSPREPGLIADGYDVHAVWADDPGSTDDFEVYYQYSIDGGLTWLDNDILLSKGFAELSTNSETRFTSQGDQFFVSYIATNNVTGSDQLRYSRSFDAGQTWSTGLTAITVPTGFYIDGATPHVTGSGNLVLAWEDDTSGSPAVYASVLPQGGSVFGAPVSLWSNSGLGGAEAQIASPGTSLEPDTVLVSFDAGTGLSAGDNGFIPSALSIDGGLSFKPAVELDTLRDGDGDYVVTTYNAIYDNYIAAWRVSDSGLDSIRSGGLRPQTVEAIGAASGGTASFDFYGFAPPSGTAKFVWVLASASPGNFALPLMDGRDMGLSPDATFLATLSNPSIFSAVVDMNGAGATPSFDVSAPTGTVIYVAGVAINLGPLSLAEITDVIPVTIL